MPKQAPLRLIRRCRLYVRRGDWKPIPHVTRGFYVLYKAIGNRKKKEYQVFYIGVGGVSKKAASVLAAESGDTIRRRRVGTHYSFFEVHDNIFREEILELESLLLPDFSAR